LDYYHVCEHLHQFANTIITDEAELKIWTEKQKELLLQSKVTEVIENIKQKDSES
jgi:predicted GIY-YIG superfamily endonuclease